MNALQIIQRLRPIGLPPGQYCAFGSATMALLGIRDAKDVDVLATPELCEILKNSGWTEEIIDAGKPPKKTPVLRNPQHPDVDVFQTWDYEGFNRTPAEIIGDAHEADGAYFATLVDVICWKEAYGREKDLADLQLIEKHLERVKRFIHR